MLLSIWFLFGIATWLLIAFVIVSYSSTKKKKSNELSEVVEKDYLSSHSIIMNELCQSNLEALGSNCLECDFQLIIENTGYCNLPKNIGLKCPQKENNKVKTIV